MKKTTTKFLIKNIMIRKIRTHAFCHTTTTADGYATTEPRYHKLK
jgi:hypothetical protein